ncbi:hypothetical protein GCM10011345_14000 [Gemmobacter megaterium]|nr:hypothetical protein GCM10011345_14000 [Gemmobacter megaterium]
MDGRAAKPARRAGYHACSLRISAPPSGGHSLLLVDRSTAKVPLTKPVAARREFQQKMCLIPALRDKADVRAGSSCRKEAAQVVVKMRCPEGRLEHQGVPSRSRYEVPLTA